MGQLGQPSWLCCAAVLQSCCWYGHTLGVWKMNGMNGCADCQIQRQPSVESVGSVGWLKCGCCHTLATPWPTPWPNTTARYWEGRWERGHKVCDVTSLPTPWPAKSLFFSYTHHSLFLTLPCCEGMLGRVGHLMVNTAQLSTLWHLHGSSKYAQMAVEISKLSSSYQLPDHPLWLALTKK